MKDFMDSHIQVTGIGFGSKDKDNQVAKDTKKALKKGLNK